MCDDGPDCCDEHEACIDDMVLGQVERTHVHGRCLHRWRTAVWTADELEPEHVTDICDHCDEQIAPRTETV